jgi:hypothetical protein
MKRRLLLLSLTLLVLVCGQSACGQSNIRPTSDPNATWLSFERSGGIAGFQDKLVLRASGEYHLTGRVQAERSGTLDANQRTQLQTWQGRFSSFALTLEDNPGGPDNMTRKLVWSGTGADKPSEAEQRQVLDWASKLLGTLSK